MIFRKVVKARYDSHDDIWNVTLECGHQVGIVDVPFGAKPNETCRCVFCEVLNEDDDDSTTSDGARE